MSVLSSSKLWKFLVATSASIALVLSGLMASPASAIPAVNDPVLRVFPLVDDDCQVNVIGVISNGFDAGTVQLEINSADSGILATLVDPTPGIAIDFNVAMSNATSSLQNNPNVSAVVVAGENPANMCKPVTVKLKYRYDGSTVLSSQVAVEPLQATKNGSHFVFPSLTKPCTYRVIVTTPKPTPQDEVKVVFSQGQGGWDIVFSDVKIDKPLDIEVDISDLEGTRNNPRVVSLLQWGEQMVCALGTYVNMAANGAGSEWNHHGNPPICDPGAYGVATATGEDAVTRGCQLAQPGHFVPEANVIGAQFPCEAGTYTSDWGAVSCTPAAIGYYVPTYGETQQVACPLGSFTSASGSFACIPAPVGTYVDTEAASASTACPAGYTTRLAGARSIHECYKPKFQTAKAIRFPAKLKSGGKIETAARTDAGLPLDVAVTGPCSVTTKNIKVKVNGVKVTQPRYVFTAGKKAGNCKVTLTSAGDSTYKAFTKVRTIKITK